MATRGDRVTPDRPSRDGAPSCVQQSGLPATSSSSDVSLFRPEVLAERQGQWLGTVLLRSSWWQRSFSVFAVIVALGVIALVTFADFTRKARVDGWLMPQQGLVRVLAPKEGVITALWVEEGMQVEAGDRLLSISAEQQSAAYGGTQAGIARNLREQRESLASERERQQDLFRQAQRGQAERVAGMREELSQLDSEIALHESRRTLGKRQLDRHRELQKNGYVSQIAVQELEVRQLEQDARLSSLRRERIGLQRELQAAQLELEELPINAKTEAATLAREIAMIDQQLARVEAERELIVTAPQAGTVTAILVESGGFADVSRPLLSIVPEDSKLQAHLFGPSRTVGFLKPGQRVLLRYDAYPYQKFGHHEGVIANISRSPLSPSTFAEQSVGSLPAADSNEPMYRITVELQQQDVVAYGEALPLQPGMKLEADIALETRPIHEWILDPLYTLTGRLEQ